MSRKGKTTREAIISLLYDQKVYSALPEAKKSTFRVYRKRLQKDGLSIEKMEELLAEHGYVVIQEKLWLN